ncbi:MAG TPA: ATP-binding protein [Streptosporangiaceae bacterium]|nr:ATP-binding protein [Streptosporangiaceae bacterium]
MRWRKVFPGREDQVRQVRTFVTELLTDHPGRDDIVLCAAELATNAIRHTASGRDGYFTTEISWDGRTVRVAVADSGAATEPFRAGSGGADDADAERGLDVLARLSASYGAEGDYRGRVVWAQFTASGDTASAAARLPLVPEPAINSDAADLALRYPGWHAWFGHWTRQWWAMPKQPPAGTALICAPTAAALAGRLEVLQSLRP